LLRQFEVDIRAKFPTELELDLWFSKNIPAVKENSALWARRFFEKWGGQ
jgi:hypothetical protein